MVAAYEVEQSKLSNIRSLAYIQYASFGPSEVIEGSIFFKCYNLVKQSFLKENYLKAMSHRRRVQLSQKTVKSEKF